MYIQEAVYVQSAGAEIMNKQVNMSADNKKDKSVNIYVMTHKKFPEPDDKMYIPLQVGKKGKEDLGYLTDDTGDNISELNKYYSELTGVYWVYKNVSNIDYVGICHYRRYLVNSEGLVFTRAQLLELLQNYDIITSKCITLDNSYHYGFADNHNIKDLDMTGQVIKEKYPDYYKLYLKLVNSNHTYFGNMCIMSKQLFDKYCKWLFDILFEVQKRINIDSYDDYHKRVFGFISEFLLYLWVIKNNLKPLECKVGLIGEKAETGQVIKRVKEFIEDNNPEDAMQYIAGYKKKRPDITMEASDVSGDLRVLMQIIAVAVIQKNETGTCCIDKCRDADYLIHIYKFINSAVRRYRDGCENEKDIMILKRFNVSQQAVRVSAQIFCRDKKVMRNVVDRIIRDITA